MTPNQDRYYWSLWAKVKKSLVARGLSSKAADAERHNLHIKALGFAKSHSAFTNAQFDKVIGTFKAEFDDANLNAQLRQQEMPRHRVLARIDLLLDLLDLDRDYAQAILRQMNHEAKLGGPDLQLEELSETLLQEKLLPALKIACRRQWPTKAHLLNTVQNWINAADLDYATAVQRACEALHRTEMPQLDKLNYDQLLTLWHTLRQIPQGNRVAAHVETANIPF